MLRSRVVLAVVGFAAVGGPTLACWLSVTTAQLVKQSDLIVVARAEALTQDNDRARSRLVISEIIKGAVIQPRVVTLVHSGTSARISTALHYRDGSQGLWLLQATGEANTFATGHPDRFVPRNAGRFQGLVDTARVFAGKRKAPVVTLAGLVAIKAAARERQGLFELRNVHAVPTTVPFHGDEDATELDVFRISDGSGATAWIPARDLALKLHGETGTITALLIRFMPVDELGGRLEGGGVVLAVEWP